MNAIICACGQALDATPTHGRAGAGVLRRTAAKEQRQ
jgi:hypothetical protein